MAAAASSPGSFTGIVCFLVLFLYSTWIGDVFPKMPTSTLIVVELAILAFCEFGPLSDFGARKLCHSCSGLLMLHLDPRDALARYFVYAVAASSLTMVWQVGIKFKFRYASTRDIGISVYLVLVVVFFYNQLPLEIIKPVFFADPLGALVGRQMTESGLWNPAWTGKKTIGGSLAVFFATIATLTFGSWAQKLALSLIVALAEGLSCDYDNLFIAALVIAGYNVI